MLDPTPGPGYTVVNNTNETPAPTEGLLYRWWKGEKKHKQANKYTTRLW